MVHVISFIRCMAIGVGTSPDHLARSFSTKSPEVPKAFVQMLPLLV